MAVSTQVMDFFMDAPTFLEFQKRKTTTAKKYVKKQKQKKQYKCKTGL